jgi:hypothetical protein
MVGDLNLCGSVNLAVLLETIGEIETYDQYYMLQMRIAGFRR